MPRPKSNDTPEEKKRKRALWNKTWADKNPDKVKAIAERKVKQQLQKRQESMTHKVCDKCGKKKPVDQFLRHGPHGRKSSCLICKPTKAKPVAVVAPKPVVIEKNRGWRMVYSFTDPCEVVRVWMCGMMIRFDRGSVGAYSTMKSTFALAGDDSGKRYKDLGSLRRAME